MRAEHNYQFNFIAIADVSTRTVSQCKNTTIYILVVRMQIEWNAIEPKKIFWKNGLSSAVSVSFDTSITKGRIKL